MKLDFDISTVEYKIIHEILTRHLNLEYKVWVFGSRVKNQVKYNSDLDLAIEYSSKLNLKLLRKIKRELEESKLPFKVDVLDLSSATEEFKMLIEKDMIPFPLKYLDKVPQLRFKEFSGEWEEQRVDYLLERYSDPVEVKVSESYRQIGTRSHGKGIFHKESVTGKELGNKRVFWVHEKALVINIVFAWEHSIALTSQREKGFIASHRFPMYLPKENRCNLNFILEFFLRKYGKYLLELASPGGAGRNKTLGQSNFNELKLMVPSIEEQERIVGFLSLVDKKIEKVEEQLSLLKEYKKGVMQKIFSQELRFKKDDGEEFDEWEEKQLKDLSVVTMGQSPESSSYNNIEDGIYLIQGNADIKNRKSKPRVWTNKPTKVCQKNDLLLTVRAPVGAIAKSLHKACIGRGICAISNNELSDIEYLYQYLLWFELRWHSIEQGSTFTAISGNDIKSLKLTTPSKEEQTKIANFLTKIDQRIEASKKQLKDSKEYKKSLLQQMFI